MNEIGIGRSLWEQLKAWGPIYNLNEWGESRGLPAEHFWLLLPLIVGGAFGIIYLLIPLKFRGIRTGVFLYFCALVLSTTAWALILTNGRISTICDNGAHLLKEAIEFGIMVANGFVSGIKSLWGIEKLLGRGKDVMGTSQRFNQFRLALDGIESDYGEEIESVNVNNQKKLQALNQSYAEKLSREIRMFITATGKQGVDLPPIRFRLGNGEIEAISAAEIAGGAVGGGAGVLAALLIPVVQTTGWWIFATTSTIPLIAFAPPAAIVLGIGALILGGGVVGNLVKRGRKLKERRKSCIEAFRKRVRDIKRWAGEVDRMAERAVRKGSFFRFFRQFTWVGVAILILFGIVAAVFWRRPSDPERHVKDWIKVYGDEAKLERIYAIERDGENRVLVGRISYDKNGGKVFNDMRFSVTPTGDVSAKITKAPVSR